MPDMDRATATRFVYGRLADPRFRRRLTATAPDGSHPIVVCLPEDRFDTLVQQVSARGGAVNVIVPSLGGIIGIDLRIKQSETTALGSRNTGSRLADDCTVGLFVERLKIDVSGVEKAGYTFVVETDARLDRGSAKVVALAG